MRRILAIGIIGFVLLSSSCTREYICQCVVKYEGRMPNLPDSAVHEFFVRDTKKEAAKKCEANSTTIDENGVKMDEKCRLY